MLLRDLDADGILRPTLADACDCASGAMVENMLARDAEEGVGAFIERRAPVRADR